MLCAFFVVSVDLGVRVTTVITEVQQTAGNDQNNKNKNK